MGRRAEMLRPAGDHHLPAPAQVQRVADRDAEIGEAGDEIPLPVRLAVQERGGARPEEIVFPNGERIGHGPRRDIGLEAAGMSAAARRATAQDDAVPQLADGDEEPLAALLDEGRADAMADEDVEIVAAIAGLGTVQLMGQRAGDDGIGDGHRNIRKRRLDEVARPSRIAGDDGVARAVGMKAGDGDGDLGQRAPLLGQRGDRRTKGILDFIGFGRVGQALRAGEEGLSRQGSDPQMDGTVGEFDGADPRLRGEAEEKAGPPR